MGKAGVSRRGLEGERESDRDVDGRGEGPGVARDQNGRGGGGTEREKEKERGRNAEEERKRERRHHVLWEREWLSRLSAGLSAVQFETGHQRCLHTMATPP